MGQGREFGGQIPPRPLKAVGVSFISPEAKYDWARGGSSGAKSHPVRVREDGVCKRGVKMRQKEVEWVELRLKIVE